MANPERSIKRCTTSPGETLYRWPSHLLLVDPKGLSGIAETRSRNWKQNRSR